MAKSVKTSKQASPQEIFEEAVTLQNQNNHEGAIKRFNLALKQVPDHPAILNRYARSVAKLGDARQAERMLEKAINNEPDNADSWGILGEVQQENGNLDAAAEAYDRFRKINPDSSIGHVKFADVCLSMERYSDALPAYRRGLAIEPDNPIAWLSLSRVCMFTGKWQMAVEAADRALPHFPGDTLLLANKSVALAELGRNDEAADLVNFERFIEVQEFSAPDGYSDLKSFNDDLCSHCLAHPSLVYEPSGKTTTLGHQTDDLSQDKGNNPITPLRDMIFQAVGDYQKSHPIDPTHPFLSQRPNKCGCFIWATVLQSQGHQASHIHPSGWLSGVYYAKIPDAISANPEDQVGWIEFGRATGYPDAKAQYEVRSYQPREGMVVLFPSYFYHRTIPFTSDDQRISIAFDIVPFT